MPVALADAGDAIHSGITDANAIALNDAALGTSDLDAAANLQTLNASFPKNPDAPFGEKKNYANHVCTALLQKGKHAIAERDLRTYFVDGDDLLALVNRTPTGVLPPDYTPQDLVDIRTQKPVKERDCDHVLCLRKDAASNLADMMSEMRRQKFPGNVVSAYCGYANQCMTFLHWVNKANGDFCAATEQSALPGHSQHQLGTTVDLFTEAWVNDPRGVFRAGFGCTDAGQWLNKHSWEYGFVLSYPIHPDDRNSKQECVSRWDIPVSINPKTGYRFEHWHYRYIGKDNAAEYSKFISKGPDDAADAPTLEQWLRQKRGLLADADLPVCDGCSCGACETFSDEGVCKTDVLMLDEHGLPTAPNTNPEIKSVSSHAGKMGGSVIDVTLNLPDPVLTQTPITTDKAALYTQSSDVLHLVAYPDKGPHEYRALPSAYRIGVRIASAAKGNTDAATFPYQASLAKPDLAILYNRANVLLPAAAGIRTESIGVPLTGGVLDVALLKDGKVVSSTTVDLNAH